MYVDTNILYGWAMSQSVPYDENKFGTRVSLEEKLNLPDDSNIGLFLEVDLSCSYTIRGKTKNFPFTP